jgi:hypothetical protein
MISSKIPLISFSYPSKCRNNGILIHNNLITFPSLDSTLLERINILVEGYTQRPGEKMIIWNDSFSFLRNVDLAPSTMNAGVVFLRTKNPV